MNCLLASVLLVGFSAQAPQEPSSSHDTRVYEWEALHYGMLVEFAPGTMSSDEVGAKTKNLDPEQWVRAAKDSGMRYAVLTVKQRAGYCLWPSKLTDLPSANSVAKVDVVDMFVKACRKHGIKPGFSYVLGGDRYHQSKMNPAEYEKFCTGQIAELLTNYGPITELRLDGPADMGPDTAGVLGRIYALARRLQPDMMVMLNQARDDFSTVASCEPTYRGEPIKGAAPVPMWPTDLLGGDRVMPQRPVHNPRIQFGGKSYYLPAETCDTLQHEWLWREDDPVRPVRKLYDVYDLAERRGANFLLAVAPDAVGQIRAEALKRLKELRQVIDDSTKLPTNLAEGKAASASSTWHNDPKYAPAQLLDPAQSAKMVRWAAEDSDRLAWFQVDLGAPAEFDNATITEMWRRVRTFEIQIPDDQGGWKAIYKGSVLPTDGSMIKFPMVTAKLVRFAVTDAPMGTSLTDFEIYKIGKSKKRS